jgi:hypothetical protein
MPPTQQKTVFALDCGATNWRLYRAQYGFEGSKAHLLGEPAPSPLTSFVDRKLPAVILLTPDGSAIECFGDVVRENLDDESVRERVREYFKPCIGAHLEESPLPHQKRYTHTEALNFTNMLLEVVLEQLKREKWRTNSFDERVSFSFAYPVHWQIDHEGEIFEAFASIVRNCFSEESGVSVGFVTEPEGAILSLKHRGSLNTEQAEGVTLITDIGGSTTDLIAGEVDPVTGEVEYIGRYGEPFGGGLYDSELAKHIADDLKIPASVLAQDPSVMMILHSVARRLKETLSRRLLHQSDLASPSQRTVTIVTGDDQIFRGVVQIDGSRFKAITSALNDAFERLIEGGMQLMGLHNQEVHQIVLVGGGAQLFTLVHHLRKRFGDEKVILADNPEECVVHGVSLEYGVSLAKTRPSLVFLPRNDVDKVAEESSEAEATKSWRLTTQSGESFSLGVGHNRIGRAPTNAIHIKSDKISRFHAELRVTDGEPELVDLNSTNGTFVNEEPLTPMDPRHLKHGDTIRFGDQRFLFEEQP